MTEDALKLTTYFGERHRVGGRFVADALLDLYGEAGVATSILLRGVEGFGLRHHLRTDHSLSLSEDLPAVAVAVDRRDRIEALVDRTADLVRPGLVTLERARLYRPGTAGPPGTADGDTKLTVYFGRRERVDGVPAFVAVCELLRRHGIGGATALLGVDGTVRGERERARFFARNHDVPMMVIAVGSTGQVVGAVPALRDLLTDPLLTLERIDVCSRDGVRLRRPSAVVEPDATGLVMWQKLMVYASEVARHDGVPIHRALVRGLRANGVSGATTLRGVWGFHGDHAPHGDRLLQLGRRAPTVTIVIDLPERIAAAYDLVEKLTAERGLVTSELVPALRSTAPGRARGGLRLFGA